MTKIEAAKLVATLIAAFPHSQVSEATSRVYEEELVDLDFAIAVQACRRLRRTCEFLPTIARLRAAVRDVQAGPVRTGGEAWGDVLDAIRKVGAYRPPPRFADPLVEELVARWGWRNLCLSDGVSDRARFIDTYDKLASVRRLDEASGVPLTRRLPEGMQVRRQLTGGHNV